MKPLESPFAHRAHSPLREGSRVPSSLDLELGRTTSAPTSPMTERFGTERDHNVRHVSRYGVLEPGETFIPSPYSDQKVQILKKLSAQESGGQAAIVEGLHRHHDKDNYPKEVIVKQLTATHQALYDKTGVATQAFCAKLIKNSSTPHPDAGILVKKMRIQAAGDQTFLGLYDRTINRALKQQGILVTTQNLEDSARQKVVMRGISHPTAMVTIANATIALAQSGDVEPWRQALTQAIDRFQTAARIAEKIFDKKLHIKVPMEYGIYTTTHPIHMEQYFDIQKKSRADDI